MQRISLNHRMFEKHEIEDNFVASHKPTANHFLKSVMNDQNMVAFYTHSHKAVQYNTILSGMKTSRVTFLLPASNTECSPGKSKTILVPKPTRKKKNRLMRIYLTNVIQEWWQLLLEFLHKNATWRLADSKDGHKPGKWKTEVHPGSLCL